MAEDALPVKGVELVSPQAVAAAVVAVATTARGEICNSVPAAADSALHQKKKYKSY